MDRRRVIAMGLAAAGTGIASPIGAQSAGKSKGRAIITTETLKGAEAIHAVDFPEDALARIAPSMAEQRQAVEAVRAVPRPRSAEHTSELQSLMRLSYAVFCSQKQNTTQHLI